MESLAGASYSVLDVDVLLSDHLEAAIDDVINSCQKDWQHRR